MKSPFILNCDANHPHSRAGLPVLTMEDATKSNPEMRRWSVQGDNNLCEPDNSPVNLAAHVQLAWTPHKS